MSSYSGVKGIIQVAQIKRLKPLRYYYASFTDRSTNTKLFQAFDSYSSANAGGYHLPATASPCWSVQYTVTASKDNQLLGPAKYQSRAATHEEALPQVQVARVKSNHTEYCTVPSSRQKRLARGRRETRQMSGCSTPRETPPAAVCSIILERRERAGLSPDRHA